MTDQIKKAKQREELLSSSLKCLQLLVLGSETIRNVIISNHHFMINLLKGTVSIIIILYSTV